MTMAHKVSGRWFLTAMLCIVIGIALLLSILAYRNRQVTDQVATNSVTIQQVCVTTNRIVIQGNEARAQGRRDLMALFEKAWEKDPPSQEERRATTVFLDSIFFHLTPANCEGGP